MGLEKGSLSIHSENIFPIIKKWLYSDHDIFVRELVSNACDAITKVKRLDAFGEAKIDMTDEFRVDVILNKEKKTLKFIDNGIGMTDEEIKKYINQIAFSGAEDFLNTYKDKGDIDQIIGHFGLGFYSAFMVADKVEINTLSYKEGSQAVRWTCDGGTEFEMEPSDKTTRGTEITLFLGEDGTEFEGQYKIQATIEKYCSFMPYSVYFDVEDKEPKKDEEGNIVVEELKPLNTVEPLYVKSPSTIEDNEYKDFYRKTFNDFKEPLFWIHLNMDYPFNLKGILYFPKFNNEFEMTEGKIKLYNNQVFVADNIKEVIPEFLLLLKGVIDCPDLPLNVSRSFLQNDGFVKKISDYITKKVADKLNGLYRTDREKYEGFWDDISPFIKFGSLKDEKFYDKVDTSILYKTTKEEFFTKEEYFEKYKDKVKEDMYYATDRMQQAQYINMLTDIGIDPVLFEHSIDAPFMSFIESKAENMKFKRVDSDVSDLMKDTEEIDEEQNKKDIEKLTESFKKALNLENLIIKLESLKNTEVPAMVVLSEESRRMSEMMKMYSAGGFDESAFPTNEELVLNRNNKLVQYTLNEEADSNLSELISKQIYDLAMISHKPLSPDAMTEFIRRSNEIMTKMI
jgi:molecular chaperone HtpG